MTLGAERVLGRGGRVKWSGVEKRFSVGLILRRQVLFMSHQSFVLIPPQLPMNHVLVKWGVCLFHKHLLN